MHKGITVGQPFVSPPYKPSRFERVAQWLLPAGSSPLDACEDHPPVTVVCASDTHNSKPSLPNGDILLHAGDLSQYGTFAEIQAQLNWLSALPHAHKIVVAGNHDLLLDHSFVTAYPDRELGKPGKSRADLDWGDIVYLQDSFTSLQVGARTITVFGSPWTPACGSFAFQYDREEDVWAGKVPDETDILVAHGPPAAHLDHGKGCQYLLNEIWRARPSLVVFGHIHAAHGTESIRLDTSQMLYEKILTSTKRPWMYVLQLVLHLLWKKLDRLRTTPESPSVRLINAAVHHSTGEHDDWKAPTVCI